MANNKQSAPVDTRTMLMALAAAAVIIAIILFVPDQVKRLRGISTSPKTEISASEHELICNLGDALNTDHRSLCRIDTLPAGYRFEKLADSVTTDTKLRYLYYVPEDPGNAVAQRYTISPQAGTPDALAEATQNDTAAIGADILYDSGIRQTTVGSASAPILEQRYAVKAADTDTVYYFQTVTLYLPSGYEGQCVVITAENSGNSESCFRDSAALKALAVEIGTGITMSSPT